MTTPKITLPNDFKPTTMADLKLGLQYTAQQNEGKADDDPTRCDTVIRVEPTAEHTAKLNSKDNRGKLIKTKVASDESGLLVFWLGDEKKYAMLVKDQYVNADPKADDYLRVVRTSDLHQIHFSVAHTSAMRKERAKAKRTAAPKAMKGAGTIGKIS